MNALQGVLQALRLDLLVQLLLAVILGGAIGSERELRGRPAGLRTNILICVGAVLFTVLSQKLAGPSGDRGRVAAQILTGVGFIGAGTILHLRGAVSGLTSAATIWVVAAIGMALGCGAYLEAAGTTLLVLLVLAGLGPVEARLARQVTHRQLIIHAQPGPTTLGELEELVRRAGVDIVRSQSRVENVDMIMELELSGPMRLFDQAVLAIIHHPSVRSVSSGE
jgi:putative Mg2+ transporter-C (MgtC) family protein